MAEARRNGRRVLDGRARASGPGRRRLTGASTSPALSIYQPTEEIRSNDVWSKTRCPDALDHSICPPIRLRLAEQLRCSPGAISAGAAAKRGVVGAGCRRQGADLPPARSDQIHRQQRLAVPTGRLADGRTGEADYCWLRSEVGADAAEQDPGERLYRQCPDRSGAAAAGHHVKRNPVAETC